jgi:hypothetical protein
MRTMGAVVLGLSVVLSAARPAPAGEVPKGAGEVATAGGGYLGEPGGDYGSRQRAFLEHAAAANPSGLYSQVARLELGRGPLDEAAIRAGIATIRERRDGADFVANALVRLYSMQNPQRVPHLPRSFAPNTGSPGRSAGLGRSESGGSARAQYRSPLLSAALRAEMKQALLGLKYWVDEPGDKDLLSVWSENHQINYHSAEYLAGQLFPADTFTNNGKNGRWHLRAAERRILRWIEVKAKTGFSEWDSNNCYMNTMAALLNLAELARDRQVARRSAMLLDVMFLDMAVDSFRGTYGTAHGRTAPGTVLRGGSGEDTTGMQRIAFGMGALGKPDSAASNYLAANRRYRVARTVQLIGQHLPPELTNRERQSLRVEDAARLGLSFDDPGDFFLLTAGGQFSTPENVDKSLRMMDRLNVPRWGLVMRPWAEALRATYAELARRGQPLPDLDNSSLATVDKVTFRTPDYQLSTALDYRKGLPGSQQYIWQATLGPTTLVTTIHPGPTAKYWQGRLPRNAQHRNLLVALYDVPSERLPGPRTVIPAGAGGDAMPSPAPSEESLDPRTLAVFRRDSFDEVRQEGNWTFGRKGQAYVALWSRAPVTWSDKGVFGGEGLVAPGRKNVWLCQLGRAATDGPFEPWTRRLSAAPLSATESSIRYSAPGLGDVSFGWDGPFTVGGQEIPLQGAHRFDNPYLKALWGQSRYDIRHAGHRLLIDFARNQHRETLPAGS